MSTAEIPTREELVQRAADLGPPLRHNAVWQDHNRRLLQAGTGARGHGCGGLAKEPVDILAGSSGGSSVYLDVPVQRFSGHPGD